MGVIFIDMDGTIENLLEVWVRRLNVKYNLNVSVDDVTDWDMTLAFPSLSYEQVLSVTYDDTIWDEITPIPGAPETIKKLIDAGHEVYIVTAADIWTIKPKIENLLFKYFPFIDWQHVIITSNKKLLKGDVMIDDALHNLIGGDYKKILFDTPYNRNVDDEAEGLIRVKSWGEIEEVFFDAKR